MKRPNGITDGTEVQVSLYWHGMRPFVEFKVEALPWDLMPPKDDSQAD
jgi:hypothetical protein